MMHCVTPICTALALSNVVAAVPLVHDPIYDVSYRGSMSSNKNIEIFQGVYYGEDTSGENRFAPPKPRAPPTPGTVIDVSKPAPACPQLQIDIPPFFSKPESISEDCLNMIIVRPRDTAANASIPVMVWVHGGGVMHGSGNDPHTNPEKLVTLSEELKSPIIFVGINYRIGLFGFAASKELEAQKSMNVGLRDQRFAMEWLKEHVSSFGGDPNRILAYGLSAGGTFTSLQQVAYGGEKGVPFDRAFMMSGPPGTALNQTSYLVDFHTTSVAKLLGCGISGQAMIDCMRTLPMQRLTDASYEYARSFHPPLGLFTFIPRVDGDFLPAQASKLYREGKMARNIPTILAWTDDDGATNAGPAAAVQHENDIITGLKPWTADLLSPEQIQALMDAYPSEKFEAKAALYNANKSADSPTLTAHFYRLSAFIRDMLFTCSSIDFAQQSLKHGRAVNSSFNDVYLYTLNQSVLTPIFNQFGMDYLGTAHGSDTHYVFNGVFPEGSMDQNHLKLARDLASSAIHFAYSGRPTSTDRSKGTFTDWPSVFGDGGDDQDDLVASEMRLLVVGGPFGTNPVVLPARKATMPLAADLEQDQAGDASILEKIRQNFGEVQDALTDVLKYSKMESSVQSAAREALLEQDLFSRCQFVNSLTETLGQ